ncbi:hypothetical protein DSO57_1013764 [Entomophthora muscae]|uniref:Uncharacterized protein n=1 Tax=Entomophthora muscae TaxID=34485 RepID=A0ACC2RKB7_9FUNG|nr:hypothetical protein DSO57_1013764 [Entomophthora muscae]
MAIYLNHGNLGPKMLITLGASCMLFSLISAYYAYKLVIKLIVSAIRHQWNTEPKDALLGVEKTKTPNLQVQNFIVNQFTTKVDMLQMGKLTWEEAHRAMPVLCLHFQANTNSYSNKTVATKFPNLPANVSFNTQGALYELPLDVSNNINQSDDNVKLRALSPN